MNWRADLRAAGVARRPSNSNDADRGYIEQPGEGTADKAPPSVPRTPPHSRRPDDTPLVSRRPVTSLTPPPPERETRQIPLPQAAAPLPLPPSAAPTEPHQTLVRLVRPAEKAPEPTPPPSGQPKRRLLTRDEQNALVDRFLAGGVFQTQLAAESGTTQGNISRWVRQRQKELGRTEMAAKKKYVKRGFRKLELTTEQKLAAVKEALALGKGGRAIVAQRLGVHASNVSNWARGESLGTFGNKDKAATASLFDQTIVSSSHNGAAPASAPVSVSAPRSKRLPKPPPLIAAMPGFTEYVEALVRATTEDAIAAFMAKKFGVR
jgi:transposase-like protein